MSSYMSKCGRSETCQREEGKEETVEDLVCIEGRDRRELK